MLAKQVEFKQRIDRREHDGWRQRLGGRRGIVGVRIQSGQPADDIALQSFEHLVIRAGLTRLGDEAASVVTPDDVPVRVAYSQP